MPGGRFPICGSRKQHPYWEEGQKTGGEDGGLSGNKGQNPRGERRTEKRGPPSVPTTPLWSRLYWCKARLVSTGSKGSQVRGRAEGVILGTNADSTLLSFCIQIILVFISVLVKELPYLE